jgi:TATA-box binding protein (TBP) (component of TFIID and TFIIIB)
MLNKNKFTVDSQMSSTYSKPTLKIANIVATCRLSSTPFTPEEYVKLSERLPNSEHNIRRFHAIIMRLRFNSHGGCATTTTPSSATVLIYRSARVVLTGAGCCDEDVRKVAKRACRRIAWALDQPRRCRVTELSIKNLVGSARMPFRINAERSIQHHRQHQRVGGHLHEMSLHYDATIFPALRCRIKDHRFPSATATVLAFNNGKVIMTGLKTIEQMNLFFTKFFDFSINVL